MSEKPDAQCTFGALVIGLHGTELSAEERRWLSHPAVGGVILFSRNYLGVEQLTNLTDSIFQAAGRALLICVDHEGGRVQRFRKEFTRLPPLGVLGRIFGESPALANDYAYRHGRVMATELLLCGVDLSFAPVLDLDANSVVIGDRAFSADINTTISLSRSYVGGMHDAGMCATGKHFPGHGSVEADSHTADVCDPRTLSELEHTDLQPFAALCGELDAMMMAHVVYPAVDEMPAGYSEFWIQSILRNKLAFGGTVFSDDLGMFAARVAGDIVERVHISLKAGCDAVLVCHPDEVRKLMTQLDESFVEAHSALTRLKGHANVNREQLDRVGEWRQWKKSIRQLEQSQWA